MNRLEIKGASSLAIVYVLRMLGLFMVMPVLAVAAMEYPDYSPLLVGLAIGGYGLTQALLQIPMGILSDRIGRKPVIVIGLLLFALGSAVAGFAESMTWIVIGRIIQGAGAIAGAVMALAGDISRESERSKVMAIIGISIGFSFYLSLLLGPLISLHHGLQGIFLITAILAICCIPLVLFVVPTAVNLAPNRDTLPRLADLKALLQQPQLKRLNASVLILHMMITLLFAQLPQLLLQQQWQLEQHWQLYLPVLLASIVGMVILMRLVKLWGKGLVLQLAVLCMFAALMGFFAMPMDISHIFIATLLFFIGFNYLEANFPALVSSIAPAGKKGSAMGIFASFQFFGAFAGGLLSGTISAYLSAEWIFFIAAICCLLWLLLLKGFDDTEVMKRHSLSVDLTQISMDEIAQRLSKLAGIYDITVVEQEGTVYLKTDNKQFNLQLAKQVLDGDPLQQGQL